ncbi:hypothetical protein ACLOJK_013787 [Asimina triloba]
MVACSPLGRVFFFFKHLPAPAVFHRLSVSDMAVPSHLHTTPPSKKKKSNPLTNNLLSSCPNSQFQSISFHLSNPHNPKSPSPRLRSHAIATLVKSLFTGIVEEMGEIKHLGFADNEGREHCRQRHMPRRHRIRRRRRVGIHGGGLAPETFRKTSLIELQAGSLVNLERALQPSSRGTSTAPARLCRWCLKGILCGRRIAVDGTSLTVVNVFEEEDCFDFMLVAYAQQQVVIPLKKVGQKLNLEVDILGSTWPDSFGSESFHPVFESLEEEKEEKGFNAGHSRLGKPERGEKENNYLNLRQKGNRVSNRSEHKIALFAGTLGDWAPNLAGR